MEIIFFVENLILKKGHISWLAKIDEIFAGLLTLTEIFSVISSSILKINDVILLQT